MRERELYRYMAIQIIHYYRAKNTTVKPVYYKLWIFSVNVFLHNANDNSSPHFPIHCSTEHGLSHLEKIIWTVILRVPLAFKSPHRRISSLCVLLFRLSRIVSDRVQFKRVNTIANLKAFPI